MVFDLNFPREICMPKRILVKTEEKYFELINKNMNTHNLYTNVYNCPPHPNGRRLDYSKAHINKIYFDCDDHIVLGKGKIKKIKGDGYDEMLKIHKWCKKNNNIINYPYLTGNGYNIYIATKPDYYPKHKLGIIENSRLFIQEQLKIETDEAVKDLARISRVPFSFNHKSNAQRYCIPLIPKLIYQGNEYIKKFAEKASNVKKIFGKSNKYGKNYWDISSFDKGKTFVRKYSKVSEKETSINVKKALEKINVPFCIKNLLDQPRMNYKQRYYLIIFLRDNGFLLSETLKLLKLILDKDKFHHCVYEERQPNYIYQRDDLMFPKFETMIQEGLCDRKVPCDYCKNYYRN